jgi:hypothetical protein
MSDRKDQNATKRQHQTHVVKMEEEINAEDGANPSHLGEDEASHNSALNRNLSHCRLHHHYQAKPTPKNLSTEDSPLRNDPMWMDFDDHGFSGMTPCRGENTFATTEGFIPLVHREYDLIGSADRTFTKFVSRSMWPYYCVEHLYARCIPVLRHKERTTHAEESFADSIRSASYSVPSSTEEYLRSLGDLTDVSINHSF